MSTVTIYTTPTCPWCKKTKAFFDEHNVEYEEKNVASDQDAAKEMIEKSGQRGVPVTIIDHDGEEEIVTGFEEDKLRDLLLDGPAAEA